MSGDILLGTFPIEKAFDTSQFDCGVPALNEYLQKFALQNHSNRSARTFVALRGSQVVGYYSVAMAAAERDETPERVAKGLARHPVPLALIARLAVAKTEKGRGLGKALLKDACGRVLRAANELGCRAVVVHAKDDQAKAFYEKCGFIPSPTNQRHLFALIKDLEWLKAN
jgi:predicted N-acetyltransferase YhbS